MIRWIPYAFVRITLFFAGGVLLGIYWPQSISRAPAMGLLAAVVLIYIILFAVHKRGGSGFNLGYIGLPAVLLAGYVHASWHNHSSYPDHITTVSQPITFYRAVLTRYTEEKERSWKVEAKVLDIFAEGWKSKQGRIIFYFSKEDFTIPFQYGDVLLIRGSPQPVNPPSNPGEFDYKRFLGLRNIYHQHFLRAHEVRLIQHQPPSILMDYAIRARQWADATLRKFVQGEREHAIASALVLGVTDGLDNELLSAYAATGTMHVLAVSGLHITILYMILAWLLKPLLRWKSGAWILAIVSLFSLWGYAFITGLSPSVLRAVTMFSFLAIARPAGQNTNIYNTLAASAFCLLLFDPYLIMSVGFQLSYLAVLGIVYLHPSLYGLWEPQSYWLDQVWKITSVSMAAQVATFTLGLLYFHQFPNYFLLSNLVVIPLSSLVLIAGIAVLAVSFIPLVAGALGFILAWLIKVLNVVIFIIESFPYSLIENIYITPLGCWLLAGAVVCFILLFQYRRLYYSVAASFFILLFTVTQWNHFHKDIDIRKITVYNINGHSAIDLVDHGHVYFLADSLLLRDTEKLRFHVQPNRLASGINTVFAGEQSFSREFPGGKVIRWHDYTIFQITDRNFNLPPGMMPDAIVIANNAVTKFGQFTMLQKTSKIILDSSNSYFYCNKIMEEAKKKNVEIHSVKHNGAYELILI